MLSIHMHYAPIIDRDYTEEERKEDSLPLRKDEMNGYEYLIQNEIKLWQRCEHDNVVKIFEFFDDGRSIRLDRDAKMDIYLLMQYADYGTLMSWDEEK